MALTASTCRELMLFIVTLVSFQCLDAAPTASTLVNVPGENQKTETEKKERDEGRDHFWSSTSMRQCLAAEKSAPSL